MSMPDPFSVPLKDEEFVELGELLAAMPAPFEPMEADHMDGFLTAIALLPQRITPSEWMPFILDADGRTEAALADEADEARLEELIYRRYRSIESTLRHVRPIDPITYDIEDERGRPVGGWEGIRALAPFASGFLEAMNRWPGLADSDDELVNSALLGILRHLPEDEIGDLEDIRNDLELESPLENLKEAQEDLAMSCAEIASVTRGFLPKEERRVPPGKSISSGKKAPGRTALRRRR